MQLSEMTFTDAQPVEGYGPGFFRVGGVVHEGALLLTPSGPSAWTGLDDSAALEALAGAIDVLFFGTGKDIAHIPSDLRDRLEGAGIGVEIMASPTAARTYNVLLSEGRRIAAALLPV